MAPHRSLGRQAWRGLRQSTGRRALPRRAMATGATESYDYQTGNVEGVKYASRDLPGPTTTVAVIARAGARHQIFPGLAEGLSKFMFKATEKRTALRITRESELLGGQLMSYPTREHVVVGAKFLKDDLPYFVELLSEVLYQTKYQNHEFAEEVVPNMRLTRQLFANDAGSLALDSVHRAAFHRGLGASLHPVIPTPLPRYFNASAVAALGALAFQKNNFAVVANGADHAHFGKWMGEFFKGAKAPQLAEGGRGEEVAQSKYHGGEERIDHDGANVMVLGFPGTSNFTGGFWKPEVPVLAALLGGQTTIKWSPGFSLLSKAAEAFPGVKVSTESISYSDAGLLTVTLTNGSSGLGQAAQEVVKVIKKVASGDFSKEDLKKAVANAKFDELSKVQELTAGLEQAGAGLISGKKAYQISEVAKSLEGVTEASLKKVAQSLLEGKASVSSVGNLFLLPFASEIGLKI